MSYLASLIIPIHINSNRHDIYEKLIDIIKNSSDKFQYIFCCNKESEKILSPVGRQKKNINFIFFQEDMKIPNVAKLRNMGIKEASSEVLLFMDVDIGFNEELLIKWFNSYLIYGYSVIPCIYLTKLGEKTIKNKGDVVLKNKISISDRRYFTHLALFSFIFFADLKKIKEKSIFFDEIYDGHGFEDFDFLINYYQDELSLCDEVGFYDQGSPIISSGFKVWLSYLGYLNYKFGNICYHFPHKKSKNYRLEREKNKNHFENKNKILISKGMNGSDLFRIYYKDHQDSILNIESMRILTDLRSGSIGRFESLSQRFKLIFGF